MGDRHNMSNQASPSAFFPLHQPGTAMLEDDETRPGEWRDDPFAPVLNELTRLRLGRQLQALYEPVIDESLDPRLAELMRQLETDRGQ